MDLENGVTVRFVMDPTLRTKRPDLAVPETPFEVPENLARYGLSEVLGHLLDLKTATPFDFLGIFYCLFFCV